MTKTLIHKCRIEVDNLSLDRFRLPDDGRKWRVLARHRSSILSFLAGKANPDGTFRKNGTNYSPGEAKIRARFGFGQQWVEKLQNDLHRLGFLSWTRKNRREHREYVITIPDTDYSLGVPENCDDKTLDFDRADFPFDHADSSQNAVLTTPIRGFDHADSKGILTTPIRAQEPLNTMVKVRKTEQKTGLSVSPSKERTVFNPSENTKLHISSGLTDPKAAAKEKRKPPKVSVGEALNNWDWDRLSDGQFVETNLEEFEKDSVIYNRAAQLHECIREAIAAHAKRSLVDRKILGDIMGTAMGLLKSRHDALAPKGWNDAIKTLRLGGAVTWLNPSESVRQKILHWRDRIDGESASDDEIAYCTGVSVETVKEILSTVESAI